MNQEASSTIKRPVFRNSGVSESTLLGLVENTAPFLFSGAVHTEAFHGVPPKGGPASFLKSSPFQYIEILNEAKLKLGSAPAKGDTDLWNYFDLNLASHFATVGTFIPTDVDLAIRSKLWKNVHHDAAFLPMWETVQAFHTWDESPVSKRFVVTKSGRKLSGHQGEWFTIAMGAYATACKASKERISEIRESIEEEFKNQEMALSELREEFEQDPKIESAKRFLAGIAAVAHNLGDLDRMFELWEIDDSDILKRRVFRAGHSDARNPKLIFLHAGKVYQNMLATENHRHFALRIPKGLRQSSDFLLPFGPFFDDWGANIVAQSSAGGILNEGDLREIVEALITGWKKLNPNSIFTSQGYARALYGMTYQLGLGDVKKGRQVLENLLSPALKRDLTEGGIRTLILVSRSDFEKKWVSRLKTEMATISPPI